MNDIKNILNEIPNLDEEDDLDIPDLTEEMEDIRPLKVKQSDPFTYSNKRPPPKNGKCPICGGQLKTWYIYAHREYIGCEYISCKYNLWRP